MNSLRILQPISKSCGVLRGSSTAFAAAGPREQRPAVRPAMGANALVVICGTLAAATIALGQGLEISRSTIDAGGIVRSAAGAFELSGTIGQPDAARLTGGDLELSGGFWFGVGPVDCNDDGLVSLLDQASFEACLSGPDASPSEPPCPCFDVVADGAVDLLDFATLQREFGRP